MGTRKSLRPRLESLEPKTVLSAGVSTGPAAALAHAAARPAMIAETAQHGSPTEGHASRVAARSHASIALSGSADGNYTSNQALPDTGTNYHLTAAGRITPVGKAIVKGSFRTPGFILNGQVSGTLRIVGPHGTLKLSLRIPGPIRPSASVSGGPLTLVNDLTYTIVKGTGAYAGDNGTGTVEITTTPGVATPPGSGIYAAPALTAFGRATVTFETGPVAL